MRFNLPRLIGISGLSGCGKDTLADYLVRQFGYTKYSLAKPLKDMLNARFGWKESDWLDREWKEQSTPPCGYSMKYSEQYGREHAFFSPRSWAQWLGTEVARVLAGEDVWIDRMEREWLAECRRQMAGAGNFASMVVPDVRFDNEARRIHSLGGVVIRVVRPDAAGVLPHISERGISDELINVQIVNDKDVITYLRESVYALEQCPRGV